VSEPFKIIECPRDAWQGLPRVIPTKEKVAYLRSLIAAGFRHLDAVSFVSPRKVPQMADSEKVMEALTAKPPPRRRAARKAKRKPSGRRRSAARAPRLKLHRVEVDGRPEPVEIIGIVLNEKGLERALATPGVSVIGFPYSVSPTFQRQNANQSPEKARDLLLLMRERTRKARRRLVVYLSMAFGNPYGDPYSVAAVAEAVDWLRQQRVRAVSLADTIGSATAESVRGLFTAIRPHAAGVELGLHLHTAPQQAENKVKAAFEAGCRRLDGALGGLGGCPFAADRMIGNLPTERALSALAALGVECPPAPGALATPLLLNQEIAHKYGSYP
jgi:hydroxymethylglutaryl-CoA lyase